jgi:benzoyl-CoA reductase/2-hydroxyglutaryl-CoA dehydratase subunit BcrC/BadD/HgdB
MRDIVEWLRGEVPHCDDPNNYEKWELRMLEAANEIERLREALREIIALQKANPGPLTLDDYEYVGYEMCADIARAALGEGK